MKVKLVFWVLAVLVLCSPVFGALNNNDLWAYYKADEGTGNLIDAFSTNNLVQSGTVPNASGIVKWGRGTFTSANFFSNTSVNMPNKVGTNFSLSIWINKTATIGSDNQYFLLSRNASTQGLQVFIAGTTNELRFDPGEGMGDIGTGYVPPENEWTHIVFITFENNTAEVYINGTKTVTATRTIAYNSTQLFIGKHNSIPQFASQNITVDEIGFFNVTLSASQISELYNSGAGLNYPFSGSAPVIDNSTYNFTSASSGENSTAWRDGNEAVPIRTLDDTPTVKFKTVNAAYCRIHKENQNWTTMGDTRNCSVTGDEEHVCSLGAGDALSFSSSDYQQVYIGCINYGFNNETALSTSGGLNLTLGITRAAGGVINGSGVVNGDVYEADFYFPYANYTFEGDDSSVYPSGQCKWSIPYIGYYDQNMIYNDTLKVWVGDFLTPIYVDGVYDLIINCTSFFPAIDFADVLTNFSVLNVGPYVDFWYIWDWFSGNTSFVNGLSMKYPLVSGINITAFCDDNDVSVFNISLFYENLTRITSFSTGNNYDVMFNFSQASFSTEQTYLGGSLSYGVTAYCEDVHGLSDSLTRYFKAVNLIPVSSWNVSSPQSISSVPYNFSFSCVDPEGESTVNNVYVNGSLNWSGSDSYFSFFAVDAGDYVLNLSCSDSFFSSSNASLFVSYGFLCDVAVDGVVSYERYRNNSVVVSVGCLNNISLDYCVVYVNKYAGEFFNCSGVDLLLELGRNELVFETVSVSGVRTNSSEFVVYAKKLGDSGFSAYMGLFVLVFALGLLVLAYNSFLRIGAVAVLIGVGGFVLGSAFLAFSFWAGGLIMVCSLFFVLYEVLVKP